MLVFTQTLLLATLAGFNLAGFLAKTALVWGLVELFLRLRQGAKAPGRLRVQTNHWWLLLLLPLVIYFWIFSRLCLLEGTMEFDSVAHWLIKSKILYFKQGGAFLSLMHNPNLAYVHWDYPLLVPALYTLNYGALGRVDEFINKVWPFWMMLSLCLAILSLGNTWRRPHPLPIITVIILCFLPATMRYLHWEGGTIPMVFYASLTGLLIVRALTRNDVPSFAASLLMLAGCAMTKFEGILYTGFWLLALLPVCWRRRWLATSLPWKTGAGAIICLLPYVVFRLNQPICHIESGWPKTLLHSPEAAAQNFPVVLALGLGNRFFSDRFFCWAEAPGGGIQWAGLWAGWSTPVNPQLQMLPWLVLMLLGLSLWRRQLRRSAVLITLVILGVFTFLALVIACLPHLRNHNEAMIISIAADGMDRYCYPFFMTWFLGLVSLWFPEEPAPMPPAGVVREPPKQT
jgi:hypothetical protein